MFYLILRTIIAVLRNAQVSCCAENLKHVFQNLTSAQNKNIFTCCEKAKHILIFVSSLGCGTSFHLRQRTLKPQYGKTEKTSFSFLCSKNAFSRRGYSEESNNSLSKKSNSSSSSFYSRVWNSLQNNSVGTTRCRRFEMKIVFCCN